MLPESRVPNRSTRLLLRVLVLNLNFGRLRHYLRLFLVVLKNGKVGAKDIPDANREVQV